MFFLGFLFSLPVLLWIYINNWNETRLDSLTPPIIIIGVIILLTFLVSLFFLKKQNIAILYSAIFVLLFFSYGTLTRFIHQFPTITSILHSRPEKLAILLTCSILIIVFLKVNKINELSLSKLINSLIVAGIVLAIFPLVFIILHEIKRPPLFDGQLFSINNKINKNNTPDIYYLIVERYAGFETLKKRYNFRSDLERYLKKEGFYLASSRPNYPHTSLSLASSLNMNYLSSLEKNAILYKGDQTHLFSLINNSLFFNFLKNNGYAIFNFSDLWQGTEYNLNADYNFNYYGPLPAFTRLFLEETAFDFFYKKYRFEKDKTASYKTDKRLSEQYKLNKLKEVVRMNNKKIVFFHLLVTHEPYILGPLGQSLTDEEFIKTPHEKKYINHIGYSNIVLRQFVNTIKKSRRPFIIVIQADEGPYTQELRKAVDKGNFSWKKVSDDAITTHMSILNAYYFLDKNYQNLYPTISPVNNFRVILNQFFNQDLPLLEDKYFLNQDFSHLYKFKDITKKMLIDFPIK
ncbi:hypothetical protein A2690_01860 [Candidatus Roizmanbacteria bacterium RIFCSPHIGHO2_01_FULL_39_12b]|uniref:Sulfatase N-terminal domain-containing protein n=1 Tax=Candidatus Roizmanbacteria bacterium RIFCSPHIGHO2_01_FULL_39_12b TaxID=1802030 RepID=A0A1F7GBC5_9BACT|nr:MAG: hypothetical protein A2690_01860 [Candidatus Roizmanbacteria bacterium RIFCSPHIGHO2_01_FULL_39_12b]OGK46167.1 MAG: hypothetical protein A3B46_03105 [Candidatus Roizmanbacteria bacterium RIFCSPLOWO2_01_FULL_39_19]